MADLIGGKIGGKLVMGHVIRGPIQGIYKEGVLHHIKELSYL
jgi:hypothetical protein